MARVIDTSTLIEEIKDPYVKLWVYNGLDCCVTHEVGQVLESYMEGLTPEFRNRAKATYGFVRAMQLPALTMMLKGVKVNTQLRMNLIQKFEADHDKVKGNLAKITYNVFGQTLNPNSPVQLKALFYDVLKLPVVLKYDKKTKERKPSVDREALEKLQFYMIAKPIINHILAIRDIGKKLAVLKSGIDPDGRMRSSYNITGTDTGRWSSSKNAFGRGTNLQNVTDEMREMFEPDHGKKFGYNDLETAESKGVAYLSGDEQYIAACEGGDPHTYVARLVWPHLAWTGDLKKDKLIAEQPYYRHFSYRDMAKRGGHASNYYGKPFTISRHLKIEQRIAEEFQEKYFAAFPGIRLWHQSVARQLQTQRYLDTPIGRRRLFFSRADDDATLRSAIAHVPQSLIGDILNFGMLRVIQNVPEVEVLMQIHDAFLYQYDPAYEVEILAKVKHFMTVPVTVNGRVMTIGNDCQVGWNGRKFDATKNPYGLKKYKDADTRNAPSEQAPVSLLDRLVR